MQSKWCPRCAARKDVSLFGWRTTGTKRSWCKSCDSDHAKKTAVVTEKSLRRKIVVSRTARSFWSETKFERTFREQRGCCAICECPLSERRREGDTSVHADHDPLLNIPRGLLCKACNVGLGYFKDDPVMLERAANYLHTHSGVHHH